jgi:hypothetical protein
MLNLFTPVFRAINRLMSLWGLSLIAVLERRADIANEAASKLAPTPSIDSGEYLTG